MTRDLQKLAIISHLQAVDFMSAILLIHDPIILGVESASISYDKLATWRVADQPLLIHVATLYRSALMSGAIAMRALVNMLGLKAKPANSRLPSRLEVTKNDQALPGNDLQWQHIPGARGLTMEMLGSDAARGFRVRRERDHCLGLNDVLRIALRAADTSVAHLVHAGEEAETLNGDLVLASAFTCIAVQELVLMPCWGDDNADKVFEHTRAMLPGPLAIPHRQLVETLRSDLSQVFKQG